MCGVTPHANSFISTPAASAQGALGVIVEAHMCVHVCGYCGRGGVEGVYAVRCSNIGQLECGENYSIPAERKKKNIILCEER